MRETISVEVLINYLKAWCVKPEAETQGQALPENELEGADFTSTVQHIQNVYIYLHTNCPPSTLKELFQHTPAVFVEDNRCSVLSWGAYQYVRPPETTSKTQLLLS